MANAAHAADQPRIDTDFGAHLALIFRFELMHQLLGLRFIDRERRRREL